MSLALLPFKFRVAADPLSLQQCGNFPGSVFAKRLVSSNVVHISDGPLWRVLIAHERGLVRHALRTLIEAEDVVVDDPRSEVGALIEMMLRARIMRRNESGKPAAA